MRTCKCGANIEVTHTCTVSVEDEATIYKNGWNHCIDQMNKELK